MMGNTSRGFGSQARQTAALSQSERPASSSSDPIMSEEFVTSDILRDASESGAEFLSQQEKTGSAVSEEQTEAKSEAKGKVMANAPSVHRKNRISAITSDVKVGEDSDSSIDNLPVPKNKGKLKEPSVVRMEPVPEDANEDERDLSDDDEPTLGTQPKNKRGRPPKKHRPGKGSVAATPQETLISNNQEPAIRKRGGPPMNGLFAQQLGKAGPPSASDSSPLKRKRGLSAQEAKDFTPRRSGRPASELATAQMAQQVVKRPKVAGAVKASAAGPTANRKPAPVARRTVRKQSVRKGEEYAVEKIIDSRMNKKTGAEEFKVKWVGFSTADNTWEPTENLKHCAQKLITYLASRTPSKAKK